jgi:hypothetical protein
LTYILQVLGEQDAMFYMRRTRDALVTFPDHDAAGRLGPLQRPTRVSVDALAGSMPRIGGLLRQSDLRELAKDAPIVETCPQRGFLVDARRPELLPRKSLIIRARPRTEVGVKAIKETQARCLAGRPSRSSLTREGVSTMNGKKMAKMPRTGREARRG